MSDFFIIVSHTRFSDKGEAVHGTASELAPLLERKKKKYLYIQHSLFSGMATQISIFKNGRRSVLAKGLSFLPFPIRIIQEYIVTISILSQYSTKESTYIGVDPLNAFLGIFLRKMGKVKKVIFYTADYAEKRYQNTAMNAIYHWFDKFCIKHADQVWNVSSRITALRKKQSVPNNRNFFIPNAPVLKSQKHNMKFEQHTLVIVTHITKAIDFESMIHAVKHLSKKYKDSKLLIVGNGDYREDLEKKVLSLNLTKKILFTGSKSHEEVIKIVAKAGVGLAIYTNDFPWTKYGDSMKAREYLMCGLPVVITDVPSTADDIRKANAGIVIKSSKKIQEAIEYLFSNKKEYAIMRDNAFALAKESDFSYAVERTNLFTL